MPYTYGKNWRGDHPFKDDSEAETAIRKAADYHAFGSQYTTITLILIAY